MNLRQKILLLAIIPLIMGIAAITYVLTRQAKELSEQEIAVYEKKVLQAKKEELRNYIALAKTAIKNIYEDPNLPVDVAKAQVISILKGMDFGPDGYFYVYDYSGNNIVHPKLPKLVGENWWDLKDPNGDLVIRNLIQQAQKGGGYHEYLWEKPSTGKIAEKIGYAEALEKWRWMIGTGLYIDDIHAQVAASRSDVEQRIGRTFIIVAAITLMTIIIIFFSGLLINFHERRLADVKLMALTQRVIDTQEQERSRVARELHDGISQILVSVKYALERTLQLFEKSIKLNGHMDPSAEAMGQTIDKASSQLNLAINEVRRISRDLRPAMLDDLGLSPTLENLITRFSERTGIEVDFKTVVFRNLLPKEVKTALYRVAQEALTNIERHADATHVKLHLSLSNNGVLLSISDNGKGFPHEDIARSKKANVGIGLRNMQERIEYFNGSFKIISTEKGTEIQASLPPSIIDLKKYTDSGVLLNGE